MTTLGDAQVVFVGGGVMAEAILRGILRERLAEPQQLTVCEPLAARREQLAQELGVHTADDNASAAAEAQVVVLAIKPQVLPAVLPQLQGHLRPDALIISIIAGVTVATLAQLGPQALVRVMPNTPGQIGEGISVWLATLEVSPQQRALAAAIVGALGEAIEVHEEKYLDMATALSGSGPAYVFLFIEALADAGVQMGFARPVAEKLAIQTVRGAAIYAQERGEHLAILRNQVTSPGGTTAAALYELEKGGLRTTVANGVLAAYHRATALGEPKKS
jgi:pyrroline-5-carboxylate reductase